MNAPRLVLLLAVCALCRSQPVVSASGVLNSASYLPACAANGGIAQGSIFVIFGTGLGPAELRQVTSFPLQPSLSGTSVQITVAGTTVAALPIYTSANQVAALLPSRTPAGTGALTVTYADQTSAPVPIRVVQSAFGIFTLNQAGTGPAVAQNVSGASQPMNTTELAARPGQPMILWGTGLGAVTGDEAAGPVPNEPRNPAVSVWVGNQRATVTYAGRSGCCAGLDQIVFEVPASVDGCYVPVSVEVGGVHSNYGSIAVAPDSSRCRDAAPAPATGPAKTTGSILFADLEVQGALPFRGQLIRSGFNRIPESGIADGQLTQLADLFLGGPAAPAGTCTILPPANRDVTAILSPSSRPVLPLDAGGALRFTGPGGTRNAPQIRRGEYELAIERDFLPSGVYTVANDAGGADIGPFSFSAELGSVRLASTANRIPRDRDLQLTWTAPSGDGLVAIVGSSSSNTCGTRSVSFVCYERASAGQFVIPRRIVAQLPPSSTGGLFGSTGSLIVTRVNENTSRTFTAPGLDFGYFLFLGLQYRTVTFE